VIGEASSSSRSTDRHLVAGRVIGNGKPRAAATPRVEHEHSPGCRRCAISDRN